MAEEQTVAEPIDATQYMYIASTTETTNTDAYVYDAITNGTDLTNVKQELEPKIEPNNNVISQKELKAGASEVKQELITTISPMNSESNPLHESPDKTTVDNTAADISVDDNDQKADAPQQNADILPDEEGAPEDNVNPQQNDDELAQSQQEAEKTEIKQEINEPQTDTQLLNEEQEPIIEILDDEQGHKSLSLSPRITVIKETWANKRRFAGKRFPLVVCLRCNNHFFVEKADPHFTPTARQRNLKYAFTLIMDPIEENAYQLIHIHSGSYLSVRRMGKYHAFYVVSDEDLSTINQDDLRFIFRSVSDPKDVNLRVTIAWKDRYLTMKDVDLSYLSPSKSNKGGLSHIDEMNEAKTGLLGLADIDHDQEFDGYQAELKENTIKNSMPALQTRASSHLDGTDKMLIFEDVYIEHSESQIFILERVMEEEENEQIDLMFLLDLVDVPRAHKIGIPSKLHKKYRHIPLQLIELIQQIYVRIDIMKTGYAPYNDVWSQFVQYSGGMVPRVVITAFEDGVRDHDIGHKLIHIKNMISAIDTITEFYENEIKMEQLETQRQIELRKLDPIDIKLRRLDVDILKEHPMLAQWQNMSSFRRKLYDLQIYLLDKWNYDGDDIGFFLWRQHLVAIQSNFGESIFAFFQFARWLMVLNIIMALFYGVLIFTHAWNFSWFSFSYGEYIDMALGNEFLHSWWFYGAYKTHYESMDYYLKYSVQFLWVAVSLCSVFISVIAVLRVLLMAGIKDDNEYIFSQNVFANYNHCVNHPDAVTLQRNSLMIRLHETLLQRIDEETSKLTLVLLTKRLIGILLCLIVGVLSGVGIAALIYFESDFIVPYAKNIHYSMESIAPYIVPAGVSVIKAMTPHVVRAIVKFEHYSAEFLFQQTFFRVFLLRIFAILVTLFQTAQTAEKTENDEGAACAESQIGMVLYKFILFDMILEIVFYAIVPSLKYYFARLCGKVVQLTKEQELDELNRKSIMQTAEVTRENTTIKQTEFELAGDAWKSEFDIPGALVDVMYRQGIVWSGMYFSPMIPVMAVVASICTFFVKKSYLLKYCSRPKKALGVTKQLKFFYGMMLLAIVVSFVPFNYFLNRTPNCGPHSEHNVLSETETTLDQDMPSWLRTAFSYAFNGLLLLPLLVLCLVYLGYVRGLRNVHATNSKQLKQRLLKEKEEKKQILKDYNIRL